MKAKIVCKGTTGLQASAADTFTRDDDAALSQQQFNIPASLRGHAIEPYGAANEVCREAVAMVRVRGRLKAAILAQTAADRQLM